MLSSEQLPPLYHSQRRLQDSQRRRLQSRGLVVGAILVATVSNAEIVNNAAIGSC